MMSNIIFSLQNLKYNPPFWRKDRKKQIEDVLESCILVRKYLGSNKEVISDPLITEQVVDASKEINDFFS
jgi:hypothetical protein